MSNRATDRWKLAGAILVIALVIVGCILGARAHSARVRHCNHQGGHVTHHTTHHIDSHGHTHSDTTYYCVTNDRGIIDVW